MTTEPTPQPAQPAQSEPADDRLPDDHPAAKALAKANKEAEALRLRLKEIEDADKTELQKLQESIAERDAQLSDLPRQVRSQAIRFASKASQAGFLDPEDALTFIADGIDLGDDAAVDSALADLAARKPHLLRNEPKPKVAARPKAPAGEATDDNGLPKGKARAAAALRQFRNT